MLDTRWRKALRDLWLNRTRAIVAVVAMAVGIMGVGAVANARSILVREMNACYLRTTPAAAILRTDAVDSDLIQAVRGFPGIADAEARREVSARVLIGPDEWRELRLFVIPDFAAVRIDAFEPEQGSYPPATGEILIERAALTMAKTSVGSSVTVMLPGSPARELRVAGTVHAPGLAPAWMESLAYGFIGVDTLQQLGGAPTLDQIRVTVADGSLDVGHISSVTDSLAGWLAERGHAVQQIEIPEPGKHPHASQMATLLFLLAAFGGLALILSSILVANMIASLLAQQVRQIGVMKAVGARNGQIAGLYLGMVACLGALALAVGLPLATLAGRGYSLFAASMLNFDLANMAIPFSAYGLQIAIGLVVPLLAAVYPIIRGSRTTVRQAISDYGVSDGGGVAGGAAGRGAGAAGGVVCSRSGNILRQKLTSWLPRPLLLSLRNTFRRRGRLFLTLGTLAIGVACFMVAMNVSASMDSTVASKFASVRLDVMVRLARPYTIADIERAVQRVPGVASVEAWHGGMVAPVNADGICGSTFALIAPPADTQLLRNMPVIDGRWLTAGDTNALVVNQTLLAKQPGLTPGSQVKLRINGRDSAWRVVGVVREILALPSAYTLRESVAAASGLTDQAQIATVALANRDGASVAAAASALERSMADAGLAVSVTDKQADMRQRVEDHLKILAAFLTLASILVVTVGGLGLASTMSLNVLERTREIGVIRAVGAQTRAIMGIVIGEGLIIGGLSWLIGSLLSWPISAWISWNFGMTFFEAPLEFAVSPLGFGLALAVIAVVAILASATVAWKAANLTVRETLSYE